MNRAYSVLDIKSVDAEKRVIRGVATTPTPDRMGDIVEPLGVEFKNPMPLLWQHQADKPVGTVKFDKPTKNGITFEARLAQIDEPGTLKDRIDEAWQSVKAGLVGAVSIGFRALEYAFIEGTGGIRFEKSEVMELSLVTIPANADATISQIKSIDTEIRAASGMTDEGRPTPPIQTDAPAATGKTVRVVKLNATARDRAKPFVIRKVRPG
jgi:HK97 family phage prohead protease